MKRYREMEYQEPVKEVEEVEKEEREKEAQSEDIFDKLERADVLVDEFDSEVPSLGQVARHKETRERISNMLRVLSPREAEVVRRYYGLRPGDHGEEYSEEETLEEIGKKMPNLKAEHRRADGALVSPEGHITRSQVLTILQKAYRKLRHRAR